MSKGKFYVRYAQYNSVNLVGGFEVYKGSIYGRYTENGNAIFWVCDNFKRTPDGRLPVHVFKGEHWEYALLPKGHLIRKWVNYAILKIGKVPVVINPRVYNARPEDLMKASRKHKKGSGQREHRYQVNNPLQWNEVTEIAHWYGKGNASVVACNIR